LKGDGGQYSFDLSKGRRIGGGEPFDQSHVGQGGNDPLLGKIAADGVAAGGSGAMIGSGLRLRRLGSAAALPTKTLTRMVELPRDLLIVPDTTTEKESSPSYPDLAE
jgi:hypothetical protein